MDTIYKPGQIMAISTREEKRFIVRVMKTPLDCFSCEICDLINDCPYGRLECVDKIGIRRHFRIEKRLSK